MKIRRQYFNGFIIFFLLISIAVPIYLIYFDRAEDALKSIPLIIYFSLPLFALSIANRLFFGKTVCILDDKGIRYEDLYIKYDYIKKVEIDLNTGLPRRHAIPGRPILDHSNIRLICSENSYLIKCAPLYMLRYLKKHKPNVKIYLSSNSKFLIGLIAAFMIFIYFIFPFIKK